MANQAPVAAPDPVPLQSAEDLDTTLPLEVVLRVANRPVQTSLHTRPQKDWRRSVYGYAALFFAVCLVLIIASRRDATIAPPPPTTPLPPPDLVSFVDTLPLQFPAPQIEESLAEALAGMTEERQSRDASIARRSCMAQIESANLFLALARSAGTAEDYATIVDAQSQRLLTAGAIDRPTLTTLADDAWTNRAKPNPAPDWWTRQYQRCEARRIAGANYIVRSD